MYLIRMLDLLSIITTILCLPSGLKIASTIQENTKDKENRKAHALSEFKKTLLQNLDLKERPEKWSGGFPDGPIGTYNERENSRHSETTYKSIVVTSHEVKNDNRCGDLSSKSSLCIFMERPHEPAGTIYDNMYLQIFQKPAGRTDSGVMEGGAVRKLSSQSITVKMLNPDGESETTLSTSHFTRKKEGYVKIKIGRKERENWIKRSGPKAIDIKLKIDCVDCYFEKTIHIKQLPIITFIAKYLPKKTKAKAKAVCTDECCLHELNVNFKSIGWDDWIGAPSTYNIGECRGSCKNSGQELSTHPGLKKVLKKSLCCAPEAYGKMTVLYKAGTNFELRDIPRVVVTECGCA